MKNRKAIIFIIGVVLCGLIVLGIVSLIQHNTARGRLLQAVHLDNATGLKETGYINWNDWLKYKTGYEIMAFSCDKTLWKTPEDWTQEQTPLSLENLESKLGIRLDHQGIGKLNVTVCNCTSWFFLDHRDAEVPFDQREYCLAYVDETADSPVVVIYRSHDLYGIE